MPAQNTIVLPAVFDAHTHLRQGQLLMTAAKYSQYCERLIVMPNTTPPIRSASEMSQYRQAVRLALGNNVEPLMTLKLTPHTRPSDVRQAADAGAIGAKLYPEGVTTNSGDGIPINVLTDIRDGKNIGMLGDVFDTMIAKNLVLLIHAELPGEECLRREDAFIPVLRQLVNTWPQLRVSVEHISSQWMIATVRELAQRGARIAGTITLQHLLCTHDDILIGSNAVGVQGGKLRPHNHCLPVPKYRDDRAAVCAAAMTDEPYFFLGSDSAPHPIASKHCVSGCAGVWSAPVLVQSLVELFERHDCLHRLRGFIHDHGCTFYGLRGTGRSLYLSRQPWEVPKEIEDLVPFRAGETIQWRLDE